MKLHKLNLIGVDIAEDGIDLMELEYKDIRLVKIGPDFCLDTLYANEAYDKPFLIESIYGEMYTVRLAWFQGAW